MATVIKRPDSKYWHAVFRVPQDNGKSKVVFRSTKKTNKREAAQVAVDIERAAQAEAGASDNQARQMLAIITRATEDASRGAMTEKKGRQYICDIVKIATGKDLKEYSTRDWCDEWLVKQSGLASGTLTNYSAGITSFLDFLGDRQNQTIKGILPADITDFRKWMIDGSGKGKAVSLRTVNQKVKYIQIVMKAALDEGIIEKNPAAGIKATEDDETVNRIPFTKEEVNKLILNAKNDEWRRFFTLAVFTGLRMGDCMGMRWSDIDLDNPKPENRVITIMPAKTRRKKIKIKIPIHPTLLVSLSEVKNKSGLVFPTISEIPVAGGGGMSARFVRIMAAAGVSRGAERKIGKKTLYEKSFHSFRHTLTSWLANAGVSPELRMSITGHTADDTHKLYTHHTAKKLSAAMDSVPALTTKNQ